jgi:hypothetical protein
LSQNINKWDILALLIKSINLLLLFYNQFIPISYKFPSSLFISILKLAFVYIAILPNLFYEIIVSYFKASGQNKGTCKKKDTPRRLFFSETVLLNDVFFLKN